MNLSKKSRYGLTALIDLSIYSKNGHVALNSIAERNHISPQYLEQVFAALRRAGIIKSVKGPQGGYLLARKASEITVASILAALEGSYHIEAEDITPDGNYREIADTIQTQIIVPINKQLDTLLGSISLADLERDYSSRHQDGSDMYYI